MTADDRLVLDAQGVTTRFGGLVAVNAVDFDIPAGSIVSLIGPNGAGKTTFFNVIAGLSEPSQGSVHFLGREMIARGRRAGIEPVIWVLPSVVIAVLAYLLFGASLPFGLLLVVAVLLLIMLLLMAIVRPPIYERFLHRLGIFRSARPNDMVAAGIGRTFQNIRLFPNMTAMENVLIGMHTRLHSSPVD